MDYKDILMLDGVDNFTLKFFQEQNLSVCSIWRKNNYSERKYKILSLLKLEFLCYGFSKEDFVGKRKIILCDPRNSSKIVDFIHSIVPDIEIVLWSWNIVENEMIADMRYLQNKNIKIFSFDKDDCKKYGLYYNFNLLPTFKLKKLENKSTCFFCGQDKNRFSILEALYSGIYETGNRAEFIIRKDRHCSYPHNTPIKLIDKNIPYEEVLDKIAETKCLVDIVQDGQIGLTYRPLEALFYNKKLITNNKTIVDYDFYKYENIYVLDYDKRSLKEFIESDFVPWDAEIVKRYTLDNWIKNFFDNSMEKSL